MSTHTITISFVSGSGSRLSTPPSTVGRGGDNGGGARTPSPTRHSIEPPHYGVPKNIPVTSSQGIFAFSSMALKPIDIRWIRTGP